MSEIDWSMAPDATHYDQIDNNFLRQFAGISLIWHIGKGWSDHGGQYPDDLNDCERLIEKPKYFHQWTGERLPPIGTDCEAYSVLSEEWYLVKIIDHQGSNGSAACRMLTDKLFWSNKFRPIRTPEQIAAEEREKAIEEMTAGYDGKYGLLADWAAYVYDTLGYRKQGEQP